MRTPTFSLAVALAACIGLSLAACSGGNGGSDAGAGCPSSAPSAGTPCFPDGTTCSYGQTEGNCGGGTVVICTNGQWGYEATPAGSGAGAYYACPATIPTQGSPCQSSGCGGPQQSCSYGCDQGGPAYATCNGSTWQVSREGIECAVDAAIESGDGGDASDGGTSCRAATDCSPGDYCQAPGGPRPIGVSPGPSCQGDADCSADAATPLCHAGTCVCQSTPQSVPNGVCASACTTDADCSAQLGFMYGDGSGIVCGTGGHCVPKACTTATQCPANFDCSANQCLRRSCATDAECSPSGTCVDGACYPSAGTCEPVPA